MYEGTYFTLGLVIPCGVHLAHLDEVLQISIGAAQLLVPVVVRCRENESVLVVDRLVLDELLLLFFRRLDFLLATSLAVCLRLGRRRGLRRGGLEPWELVVILEGGRLHRGLGLSLVLRVRDSTSSFSFEPEASGPLLSLLLRFGGLGRALVEAGLPRKHALYRLQLGRQANRLSMLPLDVLPLRPRVSQSNYKWG